MTPGKLIAAALMLPGLAVAGATCVAMLAGRRRRA